MYEGTPPRMLIVLNDRVSALISSGLGWAALAMFVLLYLSSEVGYRIALWFKRSHEVDERMLSGAATLTGGMLALVAFMLGLTINFAQSRFEVRREHALLEANVIGTAWLRARLIGGEEGEAVAALIVQYANVRLAYTKADENGPIAQLLEQTDAMQAQVWNTITPAARRSPTAVMASLTNGLNEMFDAALSQRFAFESHVPLNVIWTLLAGSALSLGAIGYQFGLGGKRQVLMSCLLLMMWSGAIMLIVDFNRPRVGSLRVDSAPLEWTIQSFSPPAR